MRSLVYLIEHETMGQQARFERFVAEMAHILASGQHIDPDRSEKFSTQLDKVYENPFEKPKKAMSSSEIKNYVLDKIMKLKKRLRKE